MRFCKYLLALLVFFVPYSAFAALPLTSALPQDASIVSRWYLNEASGTRVDAVGSNDLTDNNTVPSLACQFDEDCADFERDNSEYLSVADASQSGLDFTSDFTASFWIRFETITGSGESRAIFSKWGSAGNRSYNMYLTHFGTGDVRYELFTSDNGTNTTIHDVAPTSQFVADTWYHIVVVYDASAGTYYMYVDGISDVSVGSFHTSLANGAAPFEINAIQESNFGDNRIQDFIMWNLALSEAEVGLLYDEYFAEPPASSSSSGSASSGSGSVVDFTLFGTGSLMHWGNASCEAFDEGGACSLYELTFEGDFLDWMVFFWSHLVYVLIVWLFAFVVVFGLMYLVVRFIWVTLVKRK